MRGKRGTSGVGKDRLPTVKGRHSEWHRDPLNYRFRRSKSPLMGNWRHDSLHKRHRRSPGRRSASLEHQPVYPSRFFDRGKEVAHDHPPLPEQYYYTRSPPQSSFGKEEFNFPHEYMFSNRPSLKPFWKPSQPVNREFPRPVADTLPSSSLGSEGQGMLLKKSTFFEEGSGRSLSLDNPMGSNFLSSERLRSSGNHFGMGLRQHEMLRFHDRPSEQYDDLDRENLYAKNSSFPVMPSSQHKPLSSTSSIMLKEDFRGLHDDRISDELTIGIGRYGNEALEHSAYSKLPLSGFLSHDRLDEPQLYGSNELACRGPDDHRYHRLNELRKRLPCVSQNEFRDTIGSSIFGCSSEMINNVNSCQRNLSDIVSLEQQVYLHRDVALGNHDIDCIRRVQDKLSKKSENWHGGSRMKSSSDHETMPFHDSSSFENDLISLTYRERPKTGSSLFSHRDMDEYRDFISTHGRSNMDDMRDYDIEKVVHRNYDFNENMNEIDSESMFVDDRNAFVRTYSPSGREDMWSNEEPVQLLPLLKHSRFRRFPKGMSRSDNLMLSNGSSSLHQKNDHDFNLKRQFKQGHSDLKGSLFSERRQGVFRSFKYRKRVTYDKLDAQGRGIIDSGAHYVKHDPMEGSEEFKQQVHKAFLCYSKLLNERACRESLFGDQGSSSKLLCAVCGSLSKEFVDAHSLVTHAYHSLKLGLRTKHLGFHKALCVVMGWNWDIPPGNSRANLSIPVPEAKSLREDLILWPPLVIIHNISIGDESITRISKVVAVEAMEEILKDMGFGAGKSSVCLGNPANQSIFVVKFMPTFSGLQEAEKLHKHFIERNHGKQEYEQIMSREHRYQNNVENWSEVDEFLYGYMAIAEDLDKLAPGIKKRSLVKSKMDIKAIADAPLNTD